MSECGLYEFTAECEPGHLYHLTVDDWGDSPLAIRYEATTDPDAEPPAVSLTSPFLVRWPMGNPGAFAGKYLRFDVPVHFRFLLTSPEPPLTDLIQVKIVDVNAEGWSNA